MRTTAARSHQKARTSLKLAAGALVLFAGTSMALGQGNLVQIPPHSSTYTGFSRGYNFVANTHFLISRLEVPPEAMVTGDTSSFVVRINGTTVYHSAGNATAYVDPMIEVQTGDTVDIVGNWSPAATGNFTARNSYAPSGVINTNIEGVAHELRRTGVQWDVGDPGWVNASWLSPSTGQPGRIFMYTLPPSTDPGGCCLNDGTCQVLPPTECSTLGGTFRGPNTDCTDPCPQPGACCFPNGSCESLLQATCEAGDGVWQGAHVECAAANCPQPPTGACCLPDGSCIVAWEPDCLSQGGIYRGDNTECGTTECPKRLTTTLVGGNSQAGAMFDLTAFESVTIVGFEYLSAATTAPSMQEIEIYAVTDRTTFEGKESDPSLWTLVETVAVERQPSPINDPVPTYVPLTMDLTIDAGETIGIYFTRNSALATTSIRYTNGPLGAFSTPHLQFEDRGVGKSYPFGSTFSPRVWNGTIFYALAEPPCYANCDVSTTEPILTVDDFTCFINEFAQAQSLPVSQQITHYANCDGSTTPPILTVDDFTCFINEFAQGCE